MTATWKDKFFEILFWLVVFSLYFSSEIVLRTYYIHGSGNSQEQLEAMAKKIPGALKDSIESTNEYLEAQKKIDEAIRLGNKNDIFEAVNTSVISLNAEEQEQVLRNLLGMYPDDPKCLNAFIHVMSPSDPKYNIGTFLKFLELFPIEQRAETFHFAWGKLSTFPNEDLATIIKHVLEKKYIYAEMFKTYNDLISIRFRLQLPVSIDSELEKLKAECFVLYKKKQLEAFKKNKKK